MFSGMTRRYFTVWEVPEGEYSGPIPDYKLPYDDVVLWFRLVRAAVIPLFLIVALVTAVWFVMPSDLSDFMKNIVSVLAIIGVPASLFLVWYFSYRVFWDWRYRPLEMASINGVMTVRQSMPKKLWWLFLPTSSDDKIYLTEVEVKTPNQYVWQYKIFFDYDTLTFPTVQARPASHKGAAATKPYKLRYVQNVAHINAIIHRVREVPQRKLMEQVDRMDTMVGLLEQISRQLAAGEPLTEWGDQRLRGAQDVDEDSTPTVVLPRIDDDTAHE